MSDPIEIGGRVGAQVQEFLRQKPNIVPLKFPERMRVLAANIALWGSKMNLTAQPNDPAEIAFHMIDSLMPILLEREGDSPLSGIFRAGRQILDLGSGGGFPGLVLAAASDAAFTLVESRRKRASFLQVAAAEMELKNVNIEAKRAEDVILKARFDLVTTRALGHPADFFTLAAKALKPHGIAMLYANPSQRPILRECTILEYEVPRRAGRVPRILAIYRQPVEQTHHRN